MAERDENGRFVKGNTAGVNNRGGGRKRKEDEDIVKAALDRAMPTLDVLARLAESVKRREPWAITLWLAYRWGRPIERTEVTGAGGDALEIRYVNDWRQGDTSTDAPQGADGGGTLSSAVQMAGGWAALAQDHARHEGSD